MRSLLYYQAIPMQMATLSNQRGPTERSNRCDWESSVRGTIHRALLYHSQIRRRVVDGKIRAGTQPEFLGTVQQQVLDLFHELVNLGQPHV